MGFTTGKDHCSTRSTCQRPAPPTQRKEQRYGIITAYTRAATTATTATTAIMATTVTTETTAMATTTICATTNSIKCDYNANNDNRNNSTRAQQQQTHKRATTADTHKRATTPKNNKKLYILPPFSFSYNNEYKKTTAAKTRTRTCKRNNSNARASVTHEQQHARASVTHEQQQCTHLGVVIGS